MRAALIREKQIVETPPTVLRFRRETQASPLRLPAAGGLGTAC